MKHRHTETPLNNLSDKSWGCATPGPQAFCKDQRGSGKEQTKTNLKVWHRDIIALCRLDSPVSFSTAAPCKALITAENVADQWLRMKHPWDSWTVFVFLYLFWILSGGVQNAFEQVTKITQLQSEAGAAGWISQDKNCTVADRIEHTPSSFARMVIGGLPFFHFGTWEPNLAPNLRKEKKCVISCDNARTLKNIEWYWR